jgi:hypothetical protein
MRDGATCLQEKEQWASVEQTSCQVTMIDLSWPDCSPQVITTFLNSSPNQDCDSDYPGWDYLTMHTFNLLTQIIFLFQSKAHSVPWKMGWSAFFPQHAILCNKSLSFAFHHYSTLFDMLGPLARWTGVLKLQFQQVVLKL